MASGGLIKRKSQHLISPSAYHFGVIRKAASISRGRGSSALRDGTYRGFELLELVTNEEPPGPLIIEHRVTIDSIPQADGCAFVASAKKRIISRLASGPRGSVYDAFLLPPDHA